MPQADLPFDSTSGSFAATHDEDRYCGPNSIVRNIYKLEFAFHRASGDDTVRAELVYRPETETFTVRRNKALYLWTAARRARNDEQRSAIQLVCDRIADDKLTEAACPLCSAALRIHDTPNLFDVTCPKGCFNYDFHRDPKDGAFLHGHFFRCDHVD